MRIRVLGTLSPQKLDLVRMPLGGIDKQELVLFCDYAEVSIPIGHIFRMARSNDGLDIFKGEMELINVTQSFLSPLDQIPAGHKTICKFRFHGVVHDLIDKLKCLDGWIVSESAIWFE
jgi:hypothetical protein